VVAWACMHCLCRVVGCGLEVCKLVSLRTGRAREKCVRELAAAALRLTRLRS
jgi:hypothetical protein